MCFVFPFNPQLSKVSQDAEAISVPVADYTHTVEHLVIVPYFGSGSNYTGLPLSSCNI